MEIMDGELVREEKPTLGVLLERLQEADDGLLNLNEDQAKALVADLAEKVDAYKYVDEKFESEIARLASRIADFQEHKKALESNRKRLRELMLFHMESKGFEKLPGNAYSVSKVMRRDIELTLGDPTPELYRKFPDLIKRSYAWNNSAVKAAIKANPDDIEIQSFGREIKTSFIKFSVRKDLLK